MDLKQLRKDHKLYQTDVAKILNCSQSRISDIENGILDLKVNELAKLIKALNLNNVYYDKLIADSIKPISPKRN